MPRTVSIGSAHTLLTTDVLANAIVPDAAEAACISRLVPNVRRSTFEATVASALSRIDQRYDPSENNTWSPRQSSGNTAPESNPMPAPWTSAPTLRLMGAAPSIGTRNQSEVSS